MQKAISKFLICLPVVAGLLYFPVQSYAGGLVAAWGDQNNIQFDQWKTTQLPEGLANIKAVAAAPEHALALRSDGTVVSWGNGQTNVPPGLSGVKAIGAGWYYNVALKADGTVIDWGGNSHVPAGISNVVAIAVGSVDDTLALKADGTVTAWGYDNYGEDDVPAGLSNITAVAVGEVHSLALKANGTVAAWGDDSYGQTDIPAGLSNVIAVAAGDYFSVALKEDGTVVAWGYNADGEISVPAGLSSVVAIAAGGYQTLALKADGNVVSWGDNVYGETNVPQGLSNVTAVAVSAFYSLAVVFSGPVQITQNPQNQVVAYPSNATFSVVATGIGPLNYQWFFNGQAIANNTHISGASDATLTIANVQITDAGTYTVVVRNALGSVISDGAVLNVTNAPPVIVGQPAGGSTAPGVNFTFAVSALGTPPLSYQWRFNGQIILGATNATLTLSNLNVNQSGYYEVVVSNPFGTAVSAKVWLGVGQNSVGIWSPYANPNFPFPTNVPSGLTNAVAVAAGPGDVLVLKRDGTVTAWTTSSQNKQPLPLIEVPSTADSAVAISDGYSSSYNSYFPNNSSMALQANGMVVAWRDQYQYNRLWLTNMPVPAIATNVAAIADGGDHYVASRSDGTVLCWGLNYYGIQTPAAVTNPPPGLSNVVAVATGNGYSLTLRNDGTVVGWGTFGSETNVPADLSNVIAISASWSGACLALKADGTVTNWGVRSLGMPPSVTNVVAISAGYNGAAALKSDGTVVAWGLYGNNFQSGISNVIALACGGGVSASPFLAYIVGDGSPFITIQPASQTVTDGSTVQFHVRAVGAQSLSYDQRLKPHPLSYQWQFNGLNLNDATNFDLILPHVTAENAGSYQAVVTNYLGSVTSKAAQLNIVSAPYNGTLAAALNATNLIWNSSSTNAPWFAEISTTHDREAAAQSGHISDSQQSTLQTTVTGPGTLTFWWKVSSEENFDFLEFFVDATNVANISGEVDWQQMTFAIPSGVHTLNWTYAKDPSVSVGQDAGWLDEVSFTPPVSAPQQLIAPAFLSDGSFSFIASNADDKFLQPSDAGSFEIQASTDLVNWVTLTNPLALTNGALQWRDTASTNYPTRFYRLMEH
jgi:alpha-tubulin suppressor-like RCC1 family protein